ncbi:MAG: WD40 repeat domain-containing serine/threonine protein kinase [Planctomycetota bacterium]
MQKPPDSSSSSPAAKRDPVEELAEEFLERARRGDEPRVEDYVQRCPERAELIRELFPTLLVLEAVAEPEPASEDISAFGATLPPVIGDHRILREIGRGGMGVVFEAEQISLGRRVALKVLPCHGIVHETLLERFRQEARAAARLHHTSIVPVFSVGESDGVLYYAMQFIRGQSLSEVLGEVKRLRRTGRRPSTSETNTPTRSVSEDLCGAPRLPESLEVDEATATDLGSTASVSVTRFQGAASRSATGESSGLTGDVTEPDSGTSKRLRYFRRVAEVGLQVAEALAYAHNEGVLHRDIKPSNILLDTRGSAWLTDFGLAKSDESLDLTGSGDVVGTLRYMAPERFEGQSLPASDVYSLGATLYELLTLEPAHAGADRAELVERVARKEPIAPRRLDPRIPRDLETIALKAMAKNSLHRYRTAAGLAADLRSFLEWKPIRARRANPVVRLWRWSQRNPATAALAALAAVLTVVILAGAAIYTVELRSERDEARHQLVERGLSEARARIRTGLAGELAGYEAAIETAASFGPSIGLRNDAIASVLFADMRPLAQGERHSQYRGTGYDPAGQRIASAGRDRDRRAELEIYSVGSSQQLERIPPPSGVPPHRAPIGIEFTPNGRWLLVRYGDRRESWLFFWSFADRRWAGRVSIGFNGFPMDLSPDGSVLAVADGNGSIRLHDVETRRLLAEAGPFPEIHQLALHPKRTFVSVVNERRSAVTIVDMERGEIVERFYHPRNVHRTSWDSTGTLLGVSCADWNSYVWEVRERRIVQVLRGHLSNVVETQFLGDGDLVLTSSWDGTTRLWSLATGVCHAKTKGGLRRICSDRRSAFLSLRSGVWSLLSIIKPRGGRVLFVPMVGKGPHRARVSPDGRWLAAACESSGANVWNLTTGERFHLPIGHCRRIGFLHDESALLTSSDGGIHRWPLTREEAESWSLGPPERLGIPGTRAHAVTLRDVIVSYRPEDGNLWLSRASRPDTVERVGQHRRVTAVNISPDGRWLISGTWKGSNVRIWDLENKDIAMEIDADSGRGLFSPDGRWVAVATGREFLVLRTGSWEVAHTIARESEDDVAGPMAFSEDSRTLAIAILRSAVALIDVESGEEIARPKSPHEGILTSLQFCRQDSVLMAATANHFIELWDLDAIRGHLSDLGLDWNSPVSRPAKTPPAKLRVDLGSFEHEPLVSSEARSRERQLEIERLSRLIEMSPDDADLLLRRSDRLREFGYLHDAVLDLNRTLELRPQDSGEVLRRRAEIYERLGETDKARLDREQMQARD